MKYSNKILNYAHILCAFIFLSFSQPLEAAESLILHDKANGIVSIHSGDGQLMFRLKYTDGCYFNQVKIRGKQMISPEKGVSSAIKVAGIWYSTREKNSNPVVKVQDNSVTIEHIKYGNKEISIEETWHLTANMDAIDWQIKRQTRGEGILEDAASAEWVFSDMQKWTGAILDNGCVAWNRLLEDKKMTYGSHAGKVLFWNKNDDRCLEIQPVETGDQHVATRFSHNPDDTHSFVHTLSDSEMKTRVNLSRFLRDSQELWKPFAINNNLNTVTYHITAPSYLSRYDLGEFNGVDEDAVREMLNTITRYGVIDSKHCGANGWRTGYVCLHEQWFAQMAMAIQDPNYTQNVSDTYDHYRDHAIQPDGRVLARFKDNNLDQMKGTYTKHGFYEAEWGYLLDSQPDYVMVVAEQFHNTGDLAWVRGQKEACEKALEYMLKRDSDGDGLMEMINQSHKDEQGSDWIDIVWAAYENALVNAEMYGAMVLWAEVETILGDQEKADRYLKAARKLKTSFNKDINDGGFWNPEKNWYIYWREKDNTTYGNNLVIPVNFTAIGYGLCDDQTRKEKLLATLETAMQKEDLFSWPLCIYPYEKKEVWVANNYPFPKYENGDIFLAWVELGTRCYANYDPGIAVKYINRIIEQYKKDGLAHQRYSRVAQSGLGNDILAGNGMAIMGLYRNIFGIQPQYNRLYLEPHLTAALNNTMVRYNLRGTDYQILLKTNQYQITDNNFTISSSRAFGMNSNTQRIEYFEGKNNTPKLSFERDEKTDLQVSVLEEDNQELPVWTLQSQKSISQKQTVYGLDAGEKYQILVESDIFEVKVADANGSLSFSLNLTGGQKTLITLAVE
ncbi:MAG: hypothetical protein HQ522_02620 [Bacteroidetes bacterium]|nr:hypothetical protein [Bacteroidota bacterium]